MSDDLAFSWDDAIRAHGRRVVVSLLALGLSLPEAEDVAQQAWIRLVAQHRSGRLSRIDLPGLAIRQARFLAWNAHAVERRRGALAPIAPSQPDEAPDPERRALDRERLERALAVLASSSASARAVVRLCYDDPPPSHADVAQRTGLSLQRVRQILCEVRARVRRALEEDR